MREEDVLDVAALQVARDARREVVGAAGLFAVGQWAALCAQDASLGAPDLAQELATLKVSGREHILHHAGGGVEERAQVRAALVSAARNALVQVQGCR